MEIFITLHDGTVVPWEPTTELICSWCRKPLADDLRVALCTCNFMYDLLLEPHAITQGKYFYTHKSFNDRGRANQCSRGDEMLRAHGVNVDWGWLSIRQVLGRENKTLRTYIGDVKKFLKKHLPAGMYDRLYDQWRPAFERHHRARPHPKPVLIEPVPPARPPRTPQAGQVYLIHAVGTTRIKIGQSQIAPVRLNNLATASPFPLLLLRSIETHDRYGLEQRLHKRYARYRVHNEWFELPADVLSGLLEEEFTDIF